MPHTVIVEAAGARQNRAAKLSATHSRYGERAVRVRVKASEREGVQLAGPGWSGLTHLG
jgi:hypothetical protein